MSAPTIRVLSPTLASQIAAGEVVERPSSVAKELVENAVDAGASRIDVSIEGGGVSLIRVVDDGLGIAEADSRLCVQRHATSKLQSLEDLGRIESFGFRGEALASIASVSKLRLVSRAASQEQGFCLRTEGGSAPVIEPLGAAVGTEIEIRDLFFNVPARRKFLRSTGTESGHITEVMEHLALCQPTLTVTLTRDGRVVREWLRTSSRLERVEQVLSEPLAPCLGERGPLRVEAYLSSPERCRQGSSGLRVFVNGRPVRQRALAATVAHAYGSVLERGRYPRGVVYLDLPARLVDVNVHPQKAEIRFADPRAVSDALHSIVSRALSDALALPVQERAAWPRRGGSKEPAGVSEPSRVVYEAVSRSPEESEGDAGAPVPELAVAANLLRISESKSASELGGWSKLEFLSQVKQTYLVCQAEDGICIIDQHAAAERVVFSKLRRQYQENSIASQALLFPVTVEMHPDEMETFTRYASDVAGMGLNVEQRGPATLSVHAVPRLLQNASPERMLRDLLAEFGRTGNRAFSGAVDKVLATMACHAAIRAGDLVRPSEAEALLRGLDGADFAGYCPHGRPIVAFLSWADLERKVGRR